MTRGRRRLVIALFFLSGCAGLVYEVLWLKDLGHVFGNAAHAAATALSVFFLGIATGGWMWGTVFGRAPLVAQALFCVRAASGDPVRNLRHE